MVSIINKIDCYIYELTACYPIKNGNIDSSFNYKGILKDGFKYNAYFAQKTGYVYYGGISYNAGVMFTTLDSPVKITITCVQCTSYTTLYWQAYINGVGQGARYDYRKTFPRTIEFTCPANSTWSFSTDGNSIGFCFGISEIKIEKTS